MTGVARLKIDIEEYREQLERKIAEKSPKAKRRTRKKVAPAIATT
jgi:hypothetical protein